MPKPYIRQSVTLADDRTARRHHLNGTAETLSPLLSATRHVLIRGRSGNGKSVLLKYLASKMAVGFLQKRSKVPILLDFRFHPLSNNTVEVLVREELESGNVELPAPVLDFLIREETWRDAFQCIIDEIESREDLDPLLDHLIQLGNPFSLRVAAYALKNKPTTMVPPGRRETFLNARLAEE